MNVPFKALEPLLQTPNLTRLWAGQMLSQVGTKMYQIALVWWFVSHYEGQSGTLISWLLVSGVAPSILLVKWIGQIVERRNLRRIILWADASAAIVCAVLLLLLYLPIEDPMIFFVVSFGLALGQAFIDPAVNKMIPHISAPKDLNFAIGLIASTATFSSFLGAICGALFIASVGLKGAIALNMLSYVVSFLFCRRIHLQQEHEDSSTQIMEPLRSVVQRHAFFVLVMVGFAATNLFLTPVLVTMPIYIKNILHGSAYTLALMEACIWVGMLVGAFSTKAAERIQDTLVLGFLTLSLIGVMLLINGFVEQTLVYGGCMLVLGFALGLLNVRFITLFQNSIPDGDKGRFFSLLTAAANIATPIGFLGFGALADRIAVTTLTAAQGIGTLVVAFFFLLLRRKREVFA